MISLVKNNSLITYRNVISFIQGVSPIQLVNFIFQIIINNK